MSMFRNLMSIPTESEPDTFICKIKNVHNETVTPYIAFPVRSAYANIPSITVTIETSTGQSQTLTITGTDLTTKNDNGTNKLGRIERFSTVSMAQDETATVTLYSKSKQFPSFSFCSGLLSSYWEKNARLCEVNTPLPVFVDGFCGSVLNNSLLTSLPNDFFQYGGSIKEMYYTFAYSSFVTVPEDLFSGLSKVTEMTSLFRYSDKLVTLPEGLFSGMPDVTNLNLCFSNCAALTSVPESLFSGLTKVTNLSSLFQGCTSLTTIPESLFSGLTKVTNLSRLFQGCTSLTTIPAGLFSGLTKVTNLSSLFYDCTSLTTIPAGLFNGLTNVVVFRYCFRNVPAKAIHPNIFCNEATEKTTRFANVTPNFSNCFDGLKGTVAGTAPALWEYTYKGTPTKSKCFSNNSTTTLSNYEDIPTEWK